MLRIKMYPASKGDAFLISASETNILVDGGYANTFDKHISHDLHDISNRREHLDLLITTHIDSDHISGVIRFLSLNGTTQARNIVPVSTIWHNSLRGLTAKNQIEIQPHEKDILEAICQRAHPKEKESVSEISARQGSTLAKLINCGNYHWNNSNGTKNISVDKINELDLPGGKVLVLSPTQQRLDELHLWWKKELRRIGYRGPTDTDDVIDDAFEFMCEHSSQNIASKPKTISSSRNKCLEDVYDPDKSPTNGSSISTIIELDGVRILMLADAWAEDVLHALRLLQSKGEPMMFDLIKISHHGSLCNSSPELLKLIDAPKYMISTNGKGHGHPSIEVLTAIVDRPAPFTRELYFNYATPASNTVKEHASKSGTPFTVYEDAANWIEIEGTEIDD